MIRISNISFFRFCWKNGKLDWPKCARTTTAIKDMSCREDGLLFGRGPNRVMETACFELVLTQMCKRHAIRANVNKASKQAKRGECLPCERLVQGKRHVGKKALLPHGT